MTETATHRPHNAKEILQEALDTITATFWIQMREFDFITGAWQGGLSYAFEGWDEVTKAFTVPLDEEVWTDGEQYQNPAANHKSKITGVCSIGAIALANATLYDEPLAPWEHISRRDVQSWRAGQALAQTILVDDPDRYRVSTDAGSIIASWNDLHGRTREEVIDVFTRALESPLLSGEPLYELTVRRLGSARPGRTSLYFTSEAYALAFVAGEERLAILVKDMWTYDLDRYQATEFVHESAVMA